MNRFLRYNRWHLYHHARQHNEEIDSRVIRWKASNIVKQKKAELHFGTACSVFSSPIIHYSSQIYRISRQFSRQMNLKSKKYFGVYQCIAINRQEKLPKNLVGIGFWCTFALVFIRMNV